MNQLSLVRRSPVIRAWPRQGQAAGPRSVCPEFLTGKRVIGFSIVVGLVAGVCELALQDARRRLIDGTALGALHLNQHAWWMVPLSDALILGVLGISAAVVARVFRARWPLAIGVAGICFAAAFSLLLVYRGLSNLAYATLALGLALQAAPGAIWLVRGRRRMARGGLAAMVCAGVVLSLLPGGRETTRVQAIEPARPGAPNVLLIVLDTVRAQSLNLGRGGRPTSPRLEALARQGTRFRQARTPAAWTLPAHAAMFTGRWAFELSTRLDQPLDDRQPTVAEYLTQHGYETAGFVANTMFGSTFFGLDRGFEHYEDVAITPVEFFRSSLLGRFLLKACLPGLAERDRPTSYFYRKDADEMNRDVLTWLDHRERERPFFAFLNYFDAHDPYIPPEGAPARFGPGPRDDHDVETLRDWHRIDKTRQSKRILRLARDRYEECVAAVDSEVGELLDELDQRGLLDQTVVIVTSDHGELIGEHGLFGHGQSLHSQVTRVPLLLVAPGRAPVGRIVTQPVSLTDLPATIVDLVGIENQSPFPGRSLARFWEPDSIKGGDEPMVLSETVDEEESDQPSLMPSRSLIMEGKVYLRGKDGLEQMYDLSGDPREKHDLTTNPRWAALLKRFREAMRRVDERALAEATAPTIAGNQTP